MQRARSPTTVVVIADGAEHVVGWIDRAPDLELVNTLMRLALTARRNGWTVHVRGEAIDELRGLLELVGLDGVVSLEPLGEAELREELGIDEVVEPGDGAL
jgi:hypothetical protein